MSGSVQPHRRQPTRLPRPWDSPGKNTRVGCHFLLQCMKVKSESEVAQSCPTPSDPMDCSLPGSSAHGIFQTRVLEWVATAFSDMVFCNEYSGLIFFRIDWFYLLAVEATLESSPTSQFKSISSSCSAFLMVHLSHPYVTTGKTIALT